MSPAMTRWSTGCSIRPIVLRVSSERRFGTVRPDDGDRPPVPGAYAGPQRATGVRARRSTGPHVKAAADLDPYAPDPVGGCLCRLQPPWVVDRGSGCLPC